jgi:hypothetical protein
MLKMYQQSMNSVKDLIKLFLHLLKNALMLLSIGKILIPHLMLAWFLLPQ